MTIARIALPVPLDKLFDYRIGDTQPKVGARVKVPFGPRQLIGMVVALPQHSDYPIEKLKAISQVLDAEPLWQPPLYQTLQWLSHYYQYPLGDTLNLLMPAALRQGKPASMQALKMWRITDQGRNEQHTLAKNAHQQARLLAALTNQAQSHSDLQQAEFSAATINSLAKKGWIESFFEAQKNTSLWPKQAPLKQAPLQLNDEQALAVATIQSQHEFACLLLEGITGSGKTEVYLQAIAPVLEQGKQVLVLVPEIGLTPQTIARFTERFDVPVAVVHSNLNDTERLKAWLNARDNHCAIVIGTRSALFTPFHDLGLIVVDEEHDASYKQQDTIRYHARDAAIMRANKEQIPIVLGSATPSLETLYNAQTGKYHHLTLKRRAGNASLTKNRLLDIKGMHCEAGLSAPLMAQMRQHLQAGNQVMLFLNRRGFAPALICHECGWLAQCPRCERYYTVHQQSQQLCCHHCATQRPLPHQCHQCGSTQLAGVGVGTEQLEQTLQHLFPDFSAIRIDRDSTRRKGSLDQALTAIAQNQHQILIGTQMLAKGHHFPNVTLVGLIDVDSALFCNDFRAPERLAQLFVQVAGRAGRASKPGEVVLQTHHPEHPLLLSLLRSGYGPFAQEALNERRIAELPPYSHLCLFRAEDHQGSQAELFLSQVKQTLEAHPEFKAHDHFIMGPMPAPMAKRAGRYRWQLILQSNQRSLRNKLISQSKTAINILPLSNKVRWSMDVDRRI